MNILVIYTHPSPKSFNHALLESFTEGLEKAGHDYEVIDLYKDQFNPVLDFAEFGNTGEDVQNYQKKITAADLLVFIYPTFWFRPPAMLEGFIDRVFGKDFAFRYVNSRPVGLLKGKKAIVMETYGGPGWYYTLLTASRPWRQFRATLTFCGFEIEKHLPCYKVPYSADKVRQEYLERAKKVAENLK